jgi:ankyrin repeat protein
MTVQDRRSLVGSEPDQLLLPLPARDSMTEKTEPLRDLLFNAIVRQDAAGCRALLEQGAYEATSEADRQKQFLYALEDGFTEFVVALIARGAPIDIRISGVTPLSVAASAGHLELCKKLIELGASVEAGSEHGKTPLCEAAAAGRADVCSLLLECGADPNNGRSATNQPLSEAVMAESVATCKVLITAGADPELAPASAAEDYLTPFQVALESSSPEVAAFLIDRFPHLLHGETLDGQTMIELADTPNRELVRAALTADAVNVGLDKSPMGHSANARKGPTPL